jgi:hypothetical protein
MIGMTFTQQAKNIKHPYIFKALPQTLSRGNIVLLVIF